MASLSTLSRSRPKRSVEPLRPRGSGLTLHFDELSVLNLSKEAALLHPVFKDGTWRDRTDQSPGDRSWSPTGQARGTSTRIPSYAPGRRSAPAFAKPATAGVGRSVRRRQGFGGYPPLAKSAEATNLNTSRLEAQVTHSSTGRARGLLRRRTKKTPYISSSS